MKITTWNVNGIRAALRHGMLDWVEKLSPDVLCLQETKAKPDQVDAEFHALDGYTSFWHSAVRPGYSGVATLARLVPDETHVGLGIPLFDDEGRVLHHRFANVHLFNVYFPNGQRGLDRVGFKLDFYKQFLEITQALQAAGEEVIICGDFNTAHTEIDLANPKENVTTSGFLPEERVWIDYYLASGLIDPYRYLYPDRIQYTWWTYRFGARQRNIGWRIDYFMVSKNLIDRVKDVTIHNEVDGSDHCPVTMEFEF